MACKNGNYGQIGQPRSLQAMRVPVYSERRANISWEAFVISLAQVMRDYPTGIPSTCCAGGGRSRRRRRRRGGPESGKSLRRLIKDAG